MESVSAESMVPRNSRSRSVMLWGLRVFLAGVFLYAGIFKVLNPVAFAGSIATFELLPESWSNIVALSLPPFELVSGLLLLTKRGLAVGSLSIALMSGAFIVALLSAIVRELPVDCGCFASSGPSTPATIALAIGRDVFFFITAVALYLNSRPRRINSGETG